MSAPASLACAKLLYPGRFSIFFSKQNNRENIISCWHKWFAETKKTKTSSKDLEPIKSTEYNLLDAASQVEIDFKNLFQNLFVSLEILFLETLSIEFQKNDRLFYLHVSCRKWEHFLWTSLQIV